MRQACMRSTSMHETSMHAQARGRAQGQNLVVHKHRLSMENEDAGAFAHPAPSRMVVHLACEEPRHRIQFVHACLSLSCQLVHRPSRSGCVASVACLALVPAGSILFILIARRAARRRQARRRAGWWHA
jgi:hypothetical protein